MIPRLISRSVHMPRSMKLKVLSSLFLSEFWTEVVRRMEVTVTLWTRRSMGQCRAFYQDFED